MLQEATLAMQDLPKLKDVAKTKEREEIFERKLKLCEVCFNFEDANGNKRGKGVSFSSFFDLDPSWNSPLDDHPPSPCLTRSLLFFALISFTPHPQQT